MKLFMLVINWKINFVGSLLSTRPIVEISTKKKNTTEYYSNGIGKLFQVG